jgi:hypothetical protein
LKEGEIEYEESASDPSISRLPPDIGFEEMAGTSQKTTTP